MSNKWMFLKFKDEVLKNSDTELTVVSFNDGFTFHIRNEQTKPLMNAIIYLTNDQTKELIKNFGVENDS